MAVTVQAGSAYLLTLLLSVEAQHLIAQLRSQVQRHVLTLPVRFFDSMKTGELVSRIMDDVEGVRNLVGTGLVQLVGGTITAVVAFTFLATIDFVMTLLVLVPLGTLHPRVDPGVSEAASGVPRARQAPRGGDGAPHGGPRGHSCYQGFSCDREGGRDLRGRGAWYLPERETDADHDEHCHESRHVFHRHRERAHYGVRWSADPSGVTDAGGSFPVHAFSWDFWSGPSCRWPTSGPK